MKYSVLHIVIPTYQAENKIEKAIKSILDQKNIDCRLYIIDHGSKDNTKAIVTKYINNPNIQYFKLSRIKNELKSPSRPLNYGIAKVLKNIKDSKNEYYMRLDADDTLLSANSTHNQIKSMKKAKLVIAPMMFNRSNKLYLYDIKDKFKTYEGINNGAIYSLAHHCSIYQIETLLKMTHFYDEKISYGEDLDFSIRYFRLLKPKDFVACKNPLVCKYFDELSITSNTNKVSFILNHLKVFNKNNFWNIKLLARVLLHALLENKAMKKMQDKFGYPGHLYGQEIPIIIKEGKHERCD